MEFDKIDDFKHSTELCSVISKRYQFEEPLDLRSMKSESKLFKPSNLTVTSIGHSLSVEIEQLNSNRIELLEKRREILDSFFYVFRPRIKREVAYIDEEIDNIERQIILLEKPVRDQEIANVKKIIEDSTRLTRKYSTIDSNI
jgi:hypothetical protein